MLNDSRTKAGALLAALWCVLPSQVAAESNSEQNTTSPNASVFGDHFDQCLVSSEENQDVNSLPTTIEADSLEGTNGDKATYKGQVVVTQGNRTLVADKVTYHQTEETVVAEGDVVLHDGQIKANSTKITSQLNTDNTTIENADYEFLCEQNRGTAKLIYSEGKNYYELKDGSVTSCPEGDNAWRLRASTIEFDQENEVANLYNPRLEIQQVPVFWLPYLTVPVGDTRKTGFLYPTVAYGSQDGFEMDVPFYWNIAPNYDLTTNVKYMQNRGVQLDGTFRLLTDFGKTEVIGQYLADDQLYTEYGDRWGLGITHSGLYKDHWKFGVDYGKVSDIEFFSDIDSDIGEREDGQLLQEGYVSYRDSNWDTTLRTRDFQLLYDIDDDTLRPYKMLPQFEANYYMPQAYTNLDIDMISHITRFEADDATSDQPASATRVHIEPGATVPFISTWGSLVSEARLLGTYYQQDIDDYSGDQELESDVSRFIPQFRSIGTLVLERDTSIYDGYTQTLEPTIQYLFIGDRDQEGIYSGYDSTNFQGDYYSLFRARKQSGVDNILAANQISYGATTRIYDTDYRERANLSFGQIVHLSERYQSESDDQLAWAFEGDFIFNDYLFYRGGMYYSVDRSEISTANSTLEYRYNKGFIQANYRYVTREYIEDTVDFDVSSITQEGISQAGVHTAYQINRKWSASGSYYYDVTESIPLELVAKLSYQSDCWYISLTYSDLIRSYDDIGVDGSEPDYEQNLGLNFGITGFGTTLGSTTGTDAGALSYGRPFTLNN